MGNIEELARLRARVVELEKLLEREKAMHSALLNNLPDRIWYKDIEGKFTKVNSVFLNHNQIDEEYLVGKSDYDLYSKEIADEYAADDLTVIDTLETLNTRHKCESEWLLTSKFPIISNNGEVLGTGGFHRIITQEVDAAEKNIIQRDFLRLIIDMIPDPIYVKDRDGRYTKVNKAKAKLLGVSHPREAIGKLDSDFYDSNKVLESRLKELHVLRTGEPIFNFTERDIDFEGAINWYSTIIAPVKDSNKTISGIVGISRNVTSQRNTLHLLSKEQDLFQRLMDNLPFFIYFKDKDSNYTRINKAFAKRLELNTSEQAIGASDFDFFNIEYAQSAIESESEMMKTGISLVGKEDCVHFLNGDMIWMSTVKIPIPADKGGYEGIVGMSIDITDRKRAEEKLKYAKERAEESERLKSAFLSNISHEVRTPMNGIIGFTNLLRNNVMEESDRLEFLNHINQCSRLLLKLFDDIIDISLIESGQVDLVVTPVDLDGLMHEFWYTYSQQLMQKEQSDVGILFIPSKPLPSVYADNFRLRQVMTHLLNNAIKYTSVGKIEFGYTLEDKAVKFFIRDSGIGIRKEKIKGLFEGYGIFKGTIAPGSQSTGLGLPISYRLVQIMGGELTVTSEIGEGSTFYFTIPYQPAVSNISYEAIGYEVYRKLNKKVVLVAENQDLSNLYITSLFKGSDVELHWVKNGFDLLQCIKTEKIDLLYYNYNIPLSNGLQTIEEISELIPSLPIVIQYNGDDPAVLRIGKTLPTVKLIAAPIIKEELISIVDTLL